MSASLSRVVPLSRVCALTGVARSSVYAVREARVVPITRARRGPKTAYADERLTASIREVLASTPFLGEGYGKVWAKLRFRGIRTSKARVLRLMRETNLLAPTRTGGPRGQQTNDGTIIPDAPDRMWGTDLTSTLTTQDSRVAVLIAVDHATAELVVPHAAKRATRHEALEPVKQAVRRCFRKIVAGVATGLPLRRDNDTQYLNETFRTEIAFLGIESSPSFVRAPEGNGCAERIIRTLNKQLLWVCTFATVEKLRLALAEWAALYNREWVIERHDHRSPWEAQRAYYA